ncbi:zinc finger CCCH domain-containing protein 11A-like [Hydractinia symbiolongicarpus]|uniref:zinc finger CCCH domain-containing protein 11A-like n=1 Tax=Hydractinia symbiolongicarpus TaxID=13093 RepID=UPI00254E98BD|nr:zinc finger CCCH domain-containing protein 11A-like [Hydractinia symbiolongicarpus]XP_057307588.1 zinc finger CCCH domain-containing protein 11A-like [Hydractinia symbiolongicarpus]
MALLGDDCYFFFNAGCSKGNQCVYRHQPAAKNTEMACPDWLKGNCVNKTCSLRHMVFDNHSNVQCHWDMTPNGCLNTHCSFAHINKTNHGKLTAAIAPSLDPVIVPSSEKTVLANVNAAHNEIVVSASSALPQPLNNISHTSLTSNNIIQQQQFRPVILGAPQHIRVPHMVVGPRAQIRHVLGVSNPQVVMPAQLTVAHQTHHASILGPPPSFPKNEHFSEQVRLFKKMLAKKNINGNDGQKNQYHSDDDDGYTRKHKHKDRQRNKKEKRSKSKSRKKSKDGFSKGDEEILYGDYKDVLIDKRSKKSDRYPSSDSDVTVKSYDEILREKALRELMIKRKEKFNEEFEDILHEKVSSKTKRTRKQSKSDDESSNSRQKEGSKKKKIDKTDKVIPENEVFSKEDALELGLDASPIRENLPSLSNENDLEKIPRKSSTKKKNTDEKTKETLKNRIDEKVVEEKVEDANAVLVFPDETVDINFSVDDDDDLALELNQAEKDTKKMPSKSKKTVSSIVNVSKSSQRAPSPPSRSRSNQKAPPSLDQSRNRKKSPERKNLDEISTASKRKVIKLKGLVETNDEKPSKDKVPSQPIVISSPPKSKDVKIKTFEEIMAEKRRRKFGNKNEVVVVSDDSENTKPAFQAANVKTNVKNDKVESKKLSLTTKRVKLRRASTEEEKVAKRKSVKLYQPPSKSDGTDEKSITSEPTVAEPAAPGGRRKIIRLRKPSVESLDNKTTAPTTSQVLSFQDIIRAKRLREKQQNEEKGKQPESVPEKKTFIKRKQELKRLPATKTLNLKTSKDTTRELPLVEKSVEGDSLTCSPHKIATEKQVSAPSAHSDVSPLHEVPEKKRRSISFNEDQLLRGSEPSTPVDSSEVFTKLSSPVSVVPRLSMSPQAKPQDETTTTNVVSTSAVSHQTASKSQPVLTETENTNENYNLETAQSTPSPSSIEDIKEALDEEKRKREKDLLSDDEFEKEINDLCSDDDEDYGDIDEDDLMMELEQMIDS